MASERPVLIKENQCRHGAGLVGQKQSCNLVLKKNEQRVWREALLKGRIFTTLQFEYSVQGVIRNAGVRREFRLLAENIAENI